MTNPLIPVGTLNRLRATVVFPSNAQLNVISSFLGRAGIRLALDGESTLFIPAMTGAVTSPEPYMMATFTIHLLKSQQLAALYKQQMELASLVGDSTIRPDAAATPPYAISNCSIQSVRELSFAGDEADFAVTLRGTYYINSNLWN